MRIVLVISSLGAGGAERVIISLANHLAQCGCEVVLITFEPPGTRPYYPVDQKVALRQLNLVACEPALQGIRQSLRRILTLRRWLKDIGPDVVISFLAKINVITLLASRGLDISVVVSERNNPDQNLPSYVWRWLRKRLYRAADRIVAPSQGVLNALPPAIRAHGCVIPNPVDCSSAHEHLDRGTTVVAVGRLEEQKGFDLLLAAFAKVADRHPDWRLVIWGDGSIRHELEDLREQLGLAQRVEMPGVTRDPGEWAREADIFVLSSRFEGFVNVVLEAMAAGLPVLSTDCPWSPAEIIRHEVDGMLVPTEDAAALAAGLEKLMSDPALRTRLGEAARRNIQRFAPEHVMAMWDEVLHEVSQRALEPPAVGSLSPSSGTS